MKLLLVIPFIASLVAGQASVGSLPTCAIGCVSSGIAATGCQLTDVHCFCTASQFLVTIAPCIKGNCSTSDQALTQTTAQGICNAANPPVQLPSFSSLLNETSSASAGASSTSSGAGSENAGATPAVTTTSNSSTSAGTAAASSSHTSASGRIEGDTRVMMALAAMVGVVAIAFFAV